MRAVQLDLLRSTARGNKGAVLFAIGLAIAFAVVSSDESLRSEREQLSERVTQLERKAQGLDPVEMRTDASVRQEIERVNEIISRLALPWTGLFGAIEDVAGEKVVLRGIAPDAKAGTVQISGEAPDWASMFDYVARLGQQPALTQVYLLHHEREPRAKARSIRFSVSASWRQ